MATIISEKSMKYLDKSTLLILLKIYFTSEHEEEIFLPKLKVLWNNHSPSNVENFKFAINQLNWIYRFFGIKLAFGLAEFDYPAGYDPNDINVMTRISKLQCLAQEHFVDVLNKNVKSSEDLRNNLAEKNIEGLHVDREKKYLEDYLIDKLVVKFYLLEKHKIRVQRFLNLFYIKNFSQDKLKEVDVYNFKRHLSEITKFLKDKKSCYGINNIEIYMNDLLNQQNYRFLEVFYYLHVQKFITIHAIDIDYEDINRFIIRFSMKIDESTNIEAPWHTFGKLKMNKNTGDIYYDDKKLVFQSSVTNQYKLLKELIENPEKKIDTKKIYELMFPNEPEYNINELAHIVNDKKGRLESIRKEIYDKINKTDSQKDFKISIKKDYVKLTKSQS